MARVILEIFLSSTSEDLRDHRKSVAKALERLRQATLRMESFGAKPKAPLPTCREQVQSCDALIVVVGHRYGWIPSEAEGGDGIKSITWWEVEWALEARKPVYAFLIDPIAPWSGAREQDALITATTEADGLAVWRAVRSLQRFRTFLESQTTRSTFNSPDNLASLATTSLFEFVLEHEVRQGKATVADATLPSPPPRTRPEEHTEFTFDVDRGQAAVVGSDIVAFAKGVPVEERYDVVNAMLLAQLAANQKVGGNSSDLSHIETWHGEFLNVLENLGFVVRQRSFTNHFEGASELAVSDAIRAVASKELRLTPEALALLLETLESLTSMSTDSPMITVFQREGMSASAARFQTILINHDDAGDLYVQLLGFGLKMKTGNAIRQMLFYRFQSNLASLRYVSANATINPRVLAALREPMAAKLDRHTDYVLGFEI